MEKLTAVTAIENWSNNTKSQSSTETIINSSGNYFILDGESISKLGTKLHVYLASDNEVLSAYAISADKDQNLSKAEINEIVIQIPLLTNNEPIPIDHYAGPQKEKAIILIESVNAWNTTKPKEMWYAKIFDENTVPLAIEIDCADFESGDTHACFFALKIDQNNYAMDLVIMNMGKNIIINPEENGGGFGGNLVFRDMARPVPPFGQEGHPSTNYSNFGILQTLGIE